MASLLFLAICLERACFSPFWWLELKHKIISNGQTMMAYRLVRMEKEDIGTNLGWSWLRESRIIWERFFSGAFRVFRLLSWSRKLVLLTYPNTMNYRDLFWPSFGNQRLWSFKVAAKLRFFYFRSDRNIYFSQQKEEIPHHQWTLKMLNHNVVMFKLL